MPVEHRVHAARLWDGNALFETPCEVRIQAGRFAEVRSLPEHVGPTSAIGEPFVRSLGTSLLLPGLVDLHVHAGPSQYGVDADTCFLSQGVTAVASQGDAGADNYAAWRAALQGAQARVCLALNLGRTGETMPGGALADLERADVAACCACIAADAADERGPLIWAVSVNLSRYSCGTVDPHVLLDRALFVARETGLPLLVGLREAADWPLSEQINLLRPEDVVTYCFRSTRTCLLDERARVLPAAVSARERGVLFDVGHGANSFSYWVAEAAIGQGFLPDTISSDFYAAHLLPANAGHGLLQTVSKLLAVGLQEADAWRAVTSVPAARLGLAERAGAIAPGRVADLTVVQREAPSWLPDADGNARPVRLWRPLAVYRDGRLVGPSGSAS